VILFVTDSHCYFDVINDQIEYAENSLGFSISCVIHLGDFGIYKSQLNNFFNRKGRRFKRPLYFIDGNHEDFNALPKLVVKYKDFFTYLPRASVNNIEGYRFLSLGGTAYMDSMNTQHGSVITDQQIEKCLSIPRDTVDIIITHDCPVGIGVPNTHGLEYYGETGFQRSTELKEHFKPKLWLFGHHHKWFSYKDSHTEYQGLSGIWKGFGLLDDNFKFTIVKHKIDWKETSMFEKLLMRFRIIRPDYPQN
jgi:predicted phosphodiesterase